MVLRSQLSELVISYSELRVRRSKRTRFSSVFASCLTALWLSTSPLYAIVWDGEGDRNWNNSANWAGNLVPTSLDVAEFPNPAPSTGTSILLGTGEAARS